MPNDQEEHGSTQEVLVFEQTAKKLDRETKQEFTPAVSPVEMTPQQLLTWAVLNDKVHLIKEVRDMERDHLDRQALLEFQTHFAEMQRDFVPVTKSRKGNFGAYANINDILAVYSPILAAHGFSATFEEEELQGKVGWKRVWSVIFGYGHTKKTYFDCPPPPENRGATDIQKQAGNSTFGKRQAFLANVGVVLQDEDKDGDDLTFEQGVALSNQITLIRESSRENFKANYATAIQGRTEDDVSILAREKQALIAKFKKEDQEGRK